MFLGDMEEHHGLGKRPRDRHRAWRDREVHQTQTTSVDYRQTASFDQRVRVRTRDRQGTWTRDREHGPKGSRIRGTHRLREPGGGWAGRSGVQVPGELARKAAWSGVHRHTCEEDSDFVGQVCTNTELMVCSKDTSGVTRFLLPENETEHCLQRFKDR